MNTFSYILKKSIHEIFLHLSAVVGLSCLWALFALPIVFLFSFQMAIIFALLILIPITVTCFAIFHSILFETRRSKVRLFFYYFHHYYLRALILGLLFAIVLMIIGAQWYYYILVNHSYLAFIFSVFQTYLCLVFLATQVYVLPILVEDDCSVFRALNQSMKLFMCHAGYSIALFVQLLCIWLLLSLSIIGFFFLYIGIYAVLTLFATQNIRSVPMAKRSISNEKYTDSISYSLHK